MIYVENFKESQLLNELTKVTEHKVNIQKSTMYSTNKCQYNLKTITYNLIKNCTVRCKSITLTKQTHDGMLKMLMKEIKKLYLKKGNSMLMKWKTQNSKDINSHKLM